MGKKRKVINVDELLRSESPEALKRMIKSAADDLTHRRMEKAIEMGRMKIFPEPKAPDEIGSEAEAMLDVTLKNIK